MSPAVKICGITRPEDAVLAARLGAEFIGLNFWPGSPRYVSLFQAREIRGEVSSAVRVVGVFVNEAPFQVEEIAGAVGLDLLQFHGDEEAEEVRSYGARAIKVLRGTAGSAAAEPFSLYPEVFAFLLDVNSPAYGGTGQVWDYRAAAGLPTSKPVFIAGGIGPENVRRALAEARPYGIDVCSRVEASPGIKDASLMRRLFAEVTDAQVEDRT